MAYEARIKELNDRYTELLGKVPFGESMRMQTAISAYTEKRKSLLEPMILYVHSTTDIKIKQSWAPKLREVHTALDDILKGMFDNVDDLSQTSYKFQGEARMADDAFFQALENAKLDDIRDGILDVEAGLKAYIAVLDAKWSSMSDTAKQIERSEEELGRDINGAAKKAIEEGNKVIDRAAPIILEYTKDLVEFFKNIPPVMRQAIADYLKARGDGSTISNMNAEMWADFFTLFFSPVKTFKDGLTAKMDPLLKATLDLAADQIKALLPFAEGYFAERVGKLRGLVPVHSIVMVAYSDSRKEADEFVRNHGIEQAKKLYENASSALDSWVNAQKGGNQSDAAAIRRDILDRLKDRTDKIADAFNEFVRDNNGKFFGSVGGQIERDFVNSAFWDEQQREIERWDLEGRLRFYWDNLAKFRPDMENAFTQMSYYISELPIPIQDKFRSILQEAQGKFLDAVTAGVDDAKSKIDKARDAARTSEVKQAMDRRPLVSAMQG